MSHPLPIPIPFLDVGAAYAELQSEIESAVLATLRTGWYIGGSEVEAFEAEFSAYTEALYCVAVANGMDALHLCLLALGLKPGDEVIVPANTYIATWLAVSQCGGIPVPVEPDERTHTIGAETIAAAITPRTKVIIPVHLYGQPAELDPIIALARQNGLRVLEDAAQAHGARYKGKRIGAHSDMVAWSFYPGKNLGALGDAGAVTTNDEELAARVRVIGNYGSRSKYVHEVRGINSRMDPVQASVLRVKLRRLDDWNSRRADIARRYGAGLPGHLIGPCDPPWADPVWHLYVVQSDRRDALQRSLAEAGISTLIHYPTPPHLQGAYRDLGYREGSFPISERIARRCLSLPIGPQMDPQSVATVLAAL